MKPNEKLEKVGPMGLHWFDDDFCRIFQPKVTDVKPYTHHTHMIIFNS